MNKRLTEVREYLGFGKSEFANKLGLKPYNIRDMESGKQKIGADLASKIEENFSISGWWLLTGKGSMKMGREALSQSREDAVQINVFEDVAASAGYGNANYEPVASDTVSFGREFLREIMRVRSFERLDIIRVVGDSMLPFIRDGEYVLVERGSDPKSGDTVIARVDDELYIKRIYKQPFSNVLRLESDNGEYPPIELDTPEKLEGFYCVGVVRSKIRLY